MFIVTGGAGFIGSNLVAALNARGTADVVVVDEPSTPDKRTNLRTCRVRDWIDKRKFLTLVETNKLPGDVEAIFHQGACTDTTQTDREYLLENNYRYSTVLLHYAMAHRIPFIYASSGAVYGASDSFAEDQRNERPLNPYGESKLLFDQHVRRHLPEVQSPVVGLRYFNVYGPNEAHKGNMASIIFQLYRQLKETGVMKLFQGTNGYADGEHERDFVFADDVVDVNMFFLEAACPKGVFNVGTGSSRTFNDVARAIRARHGDGAIQYIPMPESIRQRYQSFTCADVTALRAAGYEPEFTSL